jgi:hypothetical protein
MPPLGGSSVQLKLRSFARDPLGRWWVVARRKQRWRVAMRPTCVAFVVTVNPAQFVRLRVAVVH